MSASYVAALTFGPALAAATVALGLDAFGSRRSAVWVAALGAFAGAAVSGWAAFTLAVGQAWRVLAVGAGFSAVSSVILLLAGVAALGALDKLSTDFHGGSWAAMLVFTAVASAITASAVDLITLLLALETTAACSYALVSASRNRRSDEAAMKYFIQGSVATGIFVLGLAPLVSLYAPDGSLQSLSEALGSAPAAVPAILGGVLLVSALAFKAGAVPFHSWAPDAYETAPPALTAFLATGPKIGAISALGVLVIGFGAGPSGRQLALVLAILAVASILVGSVAALRQASYTRMLGYAGVAQVGYALVALAAGFVPSALLFIVTYAVGSAAAFSAAAAFKRLRPEWDGSIVGLRGLGRRAPMTSLALTSSLVSLSGIPPLVGFWGKFWAFGAAIQNGHLWLALVAIVGSVVSVAYYGGVLRVLYDATDSPDSDTGDESGSGGGSARISVIVLGVAVVALGLAPLVTGTSSLVTPFLFN